MEKERQAPQTEKERQDYEEAKIIIRDAGYRIVVCKQVSSRHPDKIIRLEVYGGINIPEVIKELRSLLPNFSVVEGSHQHVFITLKLQKQ